MLATTIDTLHIPPLYYSVTQQCQAAAGSPTPNDMNMPGTRFNYMLGTSSTVATENAELPGTVRDPVAEAFKPKTELGKRLLALRRAYVANGGPLLDDETFDHELQRRRGGVSDE